MKNRFADLFTGGKSPTGRTWRMDAEDPSLRERLIGMNVRRDELAKEAADLQRHLAPCQPQTIRKDPAVGAATP